MTDANSKDSAPNEYANSNSITNSKNIGTSEYANSTNITPNEYANIQKKLMKKQNKLFILSKKCRWSIFGSNNFFGG